jgi:hypothetical protein
MVVDPPQHCSVETHENRICPTLRASASRRARYATTFGSLMSGVDQVAKGGAAHRASGLAVPQPRLGLLSRTLASASTSSTARSRVARTQDERVQSPSSQSCSISGR